MAPIRRYLRITKYSVLEVRIYLEKPSDAPWLLRDQVLTRIFKEIRPKVLPKLREENENSKKKGGKKKKGIKDVVSQEDFEVVLFLSDSTTRHSLITKQKQFADKPAIKSTGSKLTGWLNNTSETAIRIEDHDDMPPGLLREDTTESRKLSDVPELGADDAKLTGDGDALFVNSSDEETFQTQREAPSRRRRQQQQQPEEEDADDKKKLALATSYDGFTMYGKILCLIVKRRGQNKVVAEPAGGSEMMESWVSTQVNQQADLDDVDG